MDAAAAADVEQIPLPPITTVEHMSFVRQWQNREHGYFAQTGDLTNYFTTHKAAALDLPVLIETSTPDPDPNTEQQQQKLREYARHMHSGIANVLIDFSPNINEGILNDPVKGVVIFQSGNNAYNLSTGDLHGYIGFDSDLLREYASSAQYGGAPFDAQLWCVAAHETAHRIDANYELLDEFLLGRENTSLYTLHQELAQDKDFMRLLTESFFRQDFCNDQAGHPQDNTGEVFATYVTIMQDPLVADRVLEIDNEYPGFKANFVRLSQVMLTLILSNSNNLSEASITNKITSLVNTLQHTHD